MNMKNAKKILSFLMTAILLVLCFPASVSAEGDDVVMESVEIISPKTLYMNFSVKMDNVHDPDSKRTEEMGMVGFYYFAAIRIVDNTTDWNLQYIGDVPLQWGGYCDYPLGFAMGETMSWTMVDTTLSCQNIEDILKLVRPAVLLRAALLPSVLRKRALSHSETVMLTRSLIRLISTKSYMPTSLLRKALTMELMLK